MVRKNGGWLNRDCQVLLFVDLILPLKQTLLLLSQERRVSEGGSVYSALSYAFKNQEAPLCNPRETREKLGCPTLQGVTSKLRDTAASGALIPPRVIRKAKVREEGRCRTYFPGFQNPRRNTEKTAPISNFLCRTLSKTVGGCLQPYCARLGRSVTNCTSQSVCCSYYSVPPRPASVTSHGSRFLCPRFDCRVEGDCWGLVVLLRTPLILLATRQRSACNPAPVSVEGCSDH